MTAEPTEQMRGFCTLCRSRCGAVYAVSDGQLTGVEPDSAHPTGGALCSKGRAAPEIVHNPRRLTTPLRRTNPKTDSDPGWVEIGWDEAMRTIAERLGEIKQTAGAEAVGFGVTSPSGTPISDGIAWVERFIRLFGSPNIAYATEICNWHKDHAHAFTFGRGVGSPDYENAELIVLWGHNPARSWLAQSTAVGNAQSRGARVAVVDPRKAGSAQNADLWLRIRPGSDGALALGVARLLIESGRYDDEFVRRWTNAPLLVRKDTGEFLRGADAGVGREDDLVVWDGAQARAYDTTSAAPEPATFALRGDLDVETTDGVVTCTPAFELYARACDEWTPERVERTTWIPEAEVRALADLIADARSVAYYSWSGVGQHTNATQTERAIACLYALTGSFDRPGGNVVRAQPPTHPATSFDQLPETQRAKALGIDERPLGPPSQGWVTAHDLYTAILDQQPYPVRALVGFGANMLVSQADTDRGREALQRLDFHVHCNPLMNPTAELADIVLPVNSPWEREALRIGFEISHEAQETIQLRQPMVERVGQSRSDTEIVFDLATRLGLEDEFFGGDADAAREHVLAPLPFGLRELRERPEGIRIPLAEEFAKYAQPADDGVRGFATPTRRVELYSELLLRHGYDPLPTYAEPTARPGDERFPYVLTSTKSAKFCHSQHRGFASLRGRAAEPTIDMHPRIASENGVADGEWVSVATPQGRIRMVARTDPSLDERVLVSEYGWWEAAPDLGLPGYDPFTDEGSNFNRLIDARNSDPVSGSVPMRSAVCAIERLPGTRTWPGAKPFRIRSLRRETPETASLLLDPVDGVPLPAYAPGQHVTITVGASGDRADTRTYSLSGTATGEPDGFQITVKREGTVSRRLVDEVEPGDIVQVTRPAGRFRLPVDPDLPVVIIAGGVGITPFMGYLEAMAHRPAGYEIQVLYSSRDGEHDLFGERLRRLAEELPGLSLRTFFTRPGDDDRQGVDYDVRGRVTAMTVPGSLIERRSRFYLCGPDAMTTELRDGLVGRGVPAFDIFTERFTAATPTWQPDPSARHSVRFERSGHTVTWTGSSGTLLELAESAGVPISAGCRSGECETCMVPLVEGSVRYLAGDADPDDDDRCVTCQSVPAADLRLDA